MEFCPPTHSNIIKSYASCVDPAKRNINFITEMLRAGTLKHPSLADLGEAICSLNVASRVRGIEYGPAQKHADHSQLLKYKQMAEKLKHDEKEMEKLQDSLLSLQLRLSARENMCRNLQDKVRHLENQLAQERNLRLKEGKPVTNNRKPSSSSIPSRLIAKPSLRPPLRPVNSSLPNPSQSNKTSNHFYLGSRLATNKENFHGVTTTHAIIPLLEPRRVTLALKGQIMQPRRRVSVATTTPIFVWHKIWVEANTCKVCFRCKDAILLQLCSFLPFAQLAILLLEMICRLG